MRPSFDEMDNQHETPWVFLQGLGSPFLAELARKLIQKGQSVIRINFSGGDPLFAGPEEQINYQGTEEDLPDFYEQLITERHIKGFILFGDERPIHKPAVQAAKAHDLDTYVVEEGYLRPNWVTFEHMGTNGNSRMPRDMDIINKLVSDQNEPGNGPDLPAPMRPRVLMDIKHQLGNIFLRYRFPNYKTHRPQPIYTEMFGWVRKTLTRPFAAISRDRLLAEYFTKQPKYFLVPLQLNSDVQIRVHSPYPDMCAFMSAVFTSFTEHADKETRLLVKLHPLDNGTVNYANWIKQTARKMGLSGRVDFIDGGDLNRLIDQSQGVVTVNSTVGLTCLRRGKPLAALGDAIYRIKGLTHDGSLDNFWQAPNTPNAQDVQKLLTLLKLGAMVEGDLFTEQGIEYSSTAAAEILLGTRSRLRLTATQHWELA